MFFISGDISGKNPAWWGNGDDYQGMYIIINTFLTVRLRFLVKTLLAFVSQLRFAWRAGLPGINPKEKDDQLVCLPDETKVKSGVVVSLGFQFPFIL